MDSADRVWLEAPLCESDGLSYWLPSDISEEELLTNRRASSRDPEAMRLYRWLGYSEETNRALARDRFPEEIDLWQRSLVIRSRPLMPGTTITPNGVLTTVEDHLVSLGFEFRLGQNLLSIGTSKLAMDAGLDGYYSQALSLCRALYESWKRAAYARRSYQTTYKWIPQNLVPKIIRSQEEYKHPGYPWVLRDWDRVFPENASNPSIDATDRLLLLTASDHIDALNEHTHPSYTGFGQHWTTGRYEIGLAPTFSEHRMQTILREINIAERLFMWEFNLLLQPQRGVRDEILGWRHDFDRLYPPDDAMEESPLSSPSP